MDFQLASPDQPSPAAPEPAAPEPAGLEPPEPAAHPFRSATIRAWLAMGSLGLISLIDLIDVVHQSRFSGLVDDYVAGRTSSAGLYAYDSFTASLAWPYLAAFVACVITFLAWLSRVVDNAPALGAGRPPRGPRAAIGWWFAPVACWFVPYRIVVDLDRRLAQMTAAGIARFLLPAWWATWVAANLLANSPRLVGDAQTVDEYKLVVALGMISSAVILVAAVLAVAVVARIQGHEDARALGLAGSSGSAPDALPGAPA